MKILRQLLLILKHIYKCLLDKKCEPAADFMSSKYRILFIANANLPTLQLSFQKPLSDLIDSGIVVTDLITEQQLTKRIGGRRSKQDAEQLFNDRISKLNPTHVIFCRYSGPYIDHMYKQIRKYSVPIIFHIDDDLLNIPIDIGKKKYDYHNQPTRLATIRFLIENADVVYCSTSALKSKIQSYGYKNLFYVGDVYCSGKIICEPSVYDVSEEILIGYMGFDHENDLKPIIPAIINVLHKYPRIKLQLFGSIPKPHELEIFGDRITTIPPVPYYNEFMLKLAALRWAIGICPLAKTEFNAVKADTKWVEYTSVGAAVIATRNTIYDRCCSDGCGILVSNEFEWERAFTYLIENKSARIAMVHRAQSKLLKHYSTQKLTHQVIHVLNLATSQLHL